MQREDLILALFNDKRMSDVTFVVNGEEIKVHKAILGSECSYFHAMLFGATNEANATRISLNETPLKQFKEVIRFCYLKKLKIGGWSTDEVCSLLSLAHEYNYDLLLEEIAKEMRKQSMLNPVSLPAFHDLAVALNLKQVLKTIKSYIEMYVGSSVVESEEFVGYSADLVSFIFTLLSLTPSTIKALWKWKATRTDQEVEKVFKSIRWETVKAKILAEVIRVLVPQTKLSKVEEPELHQEPEPGRLVHPVDDRVWHRVYDFGPHEAADDWQAI